jgi:hypothetical protein
MLSPVVKQEMGPMDAGEKEYGWIAGRPVVEAEIDSE